jgi:hypothetical protein
MRLEYQSGYWQIVCRCGWHTDPHPTLTGAAMEVDAHLAQLFPNPNDRRPCGWGKPTEAHGYQFEYDPTLLGPGEGPVIPRTEPMREASK